MRQPLLCHENCHKLLSTILVNKLAGHVKVKKSGQFFKKFEKQVLEFENLQAVLVTQLMFIKLQLVP